MWSRHKRILARISWLLVLAVVTSYLQLDLSDLRVKPVKGPLAEAAAAQGLYAEGIGTTANSTTWVDVATITAGSFTASKTYLIYANVIISSTGATAEARVRLVYGTTPTVFTDASAAYELTGVTASAGNRTNYSYMTVYTQPGTTNLIKLQISNSSTDTTTAELGQIFALKLSDDFIQNTDWCYTEVTADYTTETNFLDTSPTDAASCSLTADGSDDYFAIASAIIKMTSTNSQYRMSLYESVTNVDEPVIDIEGEDSTNEFRGHTLARTYAAPTAASHTWQPRFNDESTAYTVLSTRIFVINLAKFDQHSYSYATAEGQPAATPSWTTTQTIAPTPSVTGNWFIFGSFGNDVGTLTDDLFTRLQINAAGGGLVSNPAYGDDAPHEDSWDATDVTGFNIFKMVSLSNGGARTINLDVQMNAGTTLRVQERHLTAFSLELYVPPPYSPQMNNWRWYADEGDETPGTGYATETTGTSPQQPLAVEMGQRIPLKLRINITEVNGAGENNSRKKLQWSTDQSTWTNVSEVDVLGTFVYTTDISGGDDNVAITTQLLTGTTQSGIHNESNSAGPSNSDHTASATLELEYAFEISILAAVNTAYYFQLYDEVLAAAIPLASGKCRPKLTTAAGFVLSLLGPVDIAFGDFTLGNSSPHVHKFTADEKLTMRDNRGVIGDGWTLTADITTLQSGSYQILESSIYWVSYTTDVTPLYDAPTTGISGNTGGYMNGAVTVTSFSAANRNGHGGFEVLPEVRVYNMLYAGDYTGDLIFTLA